MPSANPSAPSAKARKSAAKQIPKLSRQLQRLLAEDRQPITAGPKDPEEAAARANLRYVTVPEPGLRRVRRAKKTFQYVNETSRRIVRDPRVLKRISGLGIPPAWEDVWICGDEDGHIQAVGRDARGRKQYRYHERWRQTRDRSKFGRMIHFAHALPGIRAAVARDLALPGLPREKVLATVVSLLANTGIRVGSDEYAKTNHHYGLTTLLDKHVHVKGEKLRFRFKGKSGKDHEVGVRNGRLARIVRRCIEIPGQRLFQYLDDAGVAHNVDSQDVNGYLHSIAGDEFTAKDFRTWIGTVTAAASLFTCSAPDTAKKTREQILQAIDAAALRLGNTRSICKASYVHPEVLLAFEEGRMPILRKAKVSGTNHLDGVETATLRLLKLAARPKKSSSAARAK